MNERTDARYFTVDGIKHLTPLILMGSCHKCRWRGRSCTGAGRCIACAGIETQHAACPIRYSIHRVQVAVLGGYRDCVACPLASGETSARALAS